MKQNRTGFCCFEKENDRH